MSRKARQTEYEKEEYFNFLKEAFSEDFDDTVTPIEPEDGKRYAFRKRPIRENIDNAETQETDSEKEKYYNFLKETFSGNIDNAVTLQTESEETLQTESEDKEYNFLKETLSGGIDNAVTYDLWNTSVGENVKRTLKSAMRDRNNKNMAVVNMSPGKPVDGEVDDSLSDLIKLRDLNKLKHLIGSEKDIILKNQLMKYERFLKGGKEGEGEEGEEEESEEEEGEIKKMVMCVNPLPDRFFNVKSDYHPMRIVKKLEDIDKSICEETDENRKSQMQNRRKFIVHTINRRLGQIGAIHNYDEKLTFHESVSKRMGVLDPITRHAKQAPEVKWKEAEEEEKKEKVKVKKETEVKLNEEDIPLSKLIAEIIPSKENEGEPSTSESHKFVRPLPSTVPAPLSIDSDDDDNADDERKDEYNSDTSDEEDIRNTVGNIPMRWYDDYDHLGYDLEGNKIVKPPAGDELDNFLRKMEDPDFWRTVKDPQTGQDVVLCNADVEVIQRLKNCKIPDVTHEEYGPWIEWFSSEVMKTPVCGIKESKKSFLPSKDESKKVDKIVKAIRKGWIKPKKKKVKKEFYMLWETDNNAEPMRRIYDHISAPKRSLPGHAESYNPPEEYLFDKREREQWKRSKPSQRKLQIMPSKYSALRHVPAYDKYTEERFRRCLDLYLCPRARKMKLLIEPDDLLPKLPSPRDLQPFPTTQSLVYKGHTEMVRTISVETKGQYLVSGSDDFTVKIWEVATGRCIRTIPVGGIVRSVSWCPNVSLSLLAVAADKKLLLINPCVGDILVVKKTDLLLEEQPEQDVLVSERVKNAIQWEQATGDDDKKKGIRVIINHFKEIKQVTWHGRGDYFATVMPDAQNRSVIIHQISKRRSQIPFNRSKGLVQCVLFHPIRPIFFVATQKFVRVYDLVKQSVMKKLFSNAKWISTMAIHPAGDNLLVGTYDRKVLWFDLDLSTKPYQTLRLHSGGVRGVAYHKNYPLFATSSDDNMVIVSHGMVYNDLLKNALIVPLKKLSFHEKINDFSVFDIVFHPTQPWLFSTGADCTIRLYT